MVVAVALAATVIGVGRYLLQPDSPWCVDSGDVNTDVGCPIEVRYADRMYVTDCVEPAMDLDIEERIHVRHHDGESETIRSAWTVRDVPPEQVIVLEGADVAVCAGTELAFGEGLSGADAAELLAARSGD